MDQSNSPSGVTLPSAIKPFALPIGLASPMWLAYGAAASVGATWWWMARLTRFVAPTAARVAAVEPLAVPSVVAPVEPPLAAIEAPFPAIEETTSVVSEPDARVATQPVAEAAPEPTHSEPSTPETPRERPDELTLIRGVGPRVADALVARGVSTFAQLAAWTEHDLAHFDKELKLLGRSKRYDFIGQAREMAETA